MDDAEAGRIRIFIFLFIRDFWIFLILLMGVAILYRVFPNVLYGAHGLDDINRKVAAEPSCVSSTAPPIVASQPQPADAVAFIDHSEATPRSSPVNPSVSKPVGSTPSPNLTAAKAAVGDFSGTFPSGDTGSGAMLSYQSETLKVAINQAHHNGATYFVADVWIRNINSFATAFAKGEYGHSIHEMPLAIANNVHAVFAVSGDYYGARDKGIVIRNGKLYRDVMGDDVCVLQRDGMLRMFLSDAFTTLPVDDTVWQAWAFGPALVKNGAVCDTSHSKIKVNNPRCGIGSYSPGHYCFIVVDGRQEGYYSGMTLDAFAKTFQDLGVADAYNLDGGATAQMIFQGKVVNRPVNGGRAVSDIICFTEG